MVEASASKSQDLQVLARFYESQKKWDLAEKTYLEAVDASAQEDARPLISLGGYYARRRSYDKALEAMKKAAEIKKDDLNIYFNRDEIYKARFFLLSKNKYADIFLKNDIQCAYFSNKENTQSDIFIFNNECKKMVFNRFGLKY